MQQCAHKWTGKSWVAEGSELASHFPCIVYCSIPSCSLLTKLMLGAWMKVGSLSFQKCINQKSRDWCTVFLRIVSKWIRKLHMCMFTCVCVHRELMIEAVTDIQQQEDTDIYYLIPLQKQYMQFFCLAIWIFPGHLLVLKITSQYFSQKFFNLLL
jgi:hypothetical protein